MPALGAEMDAGTLVRWLVKAGDRVARGDIVAEVETDKATVQVEIFEAGVIESLLVPEGERVPVGTPLARVKAATDISAVPVSPTARRLVTVGNDAAATTATREPAGPAATVHATPTARRLAQELRIDLGGVLGTGVGGVITRADVEGVARAPSQPVAAGRLLASPFARRIARDRGIDISAVQGTGPAGAVIAADIAREESRARPAPATTPLLAAATRTDARRRAIAAAMERSKREIPHYYLGATVDMTNALDWLARENAKRPVSGRILYAALLMKAVALAARELPELNGYWVDGSFRQSAAVHLGVAISLREGGLVAPAIHDADRMDPGQLMAALRDLAARARAGSLRSSEMSDPTITVTNLGEQGVETVFPIIFAPQVAIVGFGRIVERPWAVKGMLSVSPVITASLAADHRSSDGHRGGLFLRAIERFLMEPESLCRTT